MPDLEAAGIRVHCLGGEDPSLPAWPWRLRRLLLEGAYDVVHVHSPLVAGVTRMTVRTLPGRRRPRLVSTEHNDWSTFALPTRFLNGLTAGLDDASIAVSEQVRDSMWPRKVRRRTSVVVHGVPVADAAAARADRDATRRQLGVGPDELVVTTVANFRSQKAYPDLLRAARTVVDSCPAVRFMAVGQGPLEEEIRALHAQLGLGDRFLLLGYRRDVDRVLAASDVFVLASTYEGYPVALMEAMAAGLPVVATAVGGVRHAVREGVEGLLVPPGRPALLAGALTQLLLDPGRRRGMAEAAEGRAAIFDISVAARRIEEVYDSSQARGQP